MLYLGALVIICTNIFVIGTQIDLTLTNNNRTSLSFRFYWNL